MARQTEAVGDEGQLHVGLTPYNVMTNDLVGMIAGIGVPSIEIGLVAATSGLASPGCNSWDESWTWNRDALAKQPTEVLLNLLAALRETVGFQ